MPRQLWSHPGTVVFGDRVGILSFESQLHLWFWPEKWLESLQKERQLSLDRNWVYAWPVCGPFLTEPNKIFRGQRDLVSKSSPGHIPCAPWYLCTHVVGVSSTISAGVLGVKISPCIWRDHSLVEGRHVWTAATTQRESTVRSQADPWRRHTTQSRQASGRRGCLRWLHFGLVSSPLSFSIFSCEMGP